jgi:hypothetical protein
METNEITAAIVDAAYEIHNEVGPGLLEPVYELNRLGLHLRHIMGAPCLAILLSNGYRPQFTSEGIKNS